MNNIYEIIAFGEKTIDKYRVSLPPLHYSESDYVFFTGSYKDCVERVKSWKLLKEKRGKG